MSPQFWRIREPIQVAQVAMTRCRESASPSRSSAATLVVPPRNHSAIPSLSIPATMSAQDAAPSMLHGHVQVHRARGLPHIDSTLTQPSRTKAGQRCRFRGSRLRDWRTDQGGRDRRDEGCEGEDATPGPVVVKADLVRRGSLMRRRKLDRSLDRSRTLRASSLGARGWSTRVRKGRSSRVEAATSAPPANWCKMLRLSSRLECLVQTWRAARTGECDELAARPPSGVSCETTFALDTPRHPVPPRTVALHSK